MVKEPKKKLLEEITKEEFEEFLEDTLNDYQDKYNNMARMYNTYHRDKDRYTLTYFINDGVVTYQKNKKQSIGFKFYNKD